MDSHDSHVFVVRGDLTKVACDAWLATGEHGQVGSTWTDHVAPGPPQDWNGRTGKLKGRTNPALPIATDVGGVAGKDLVGWYIDGATEFVKRAIDELPAGSRLGRERRLLTMPLVGTGRGGANAGEVAKELLPRLHELADEHKVDIAIVERDAAKVSAIQYARKQLKGLRWPATPESARAVELGE